MSTRALFLVIIITPVSTLSSETGCEHIHSSELITGQCSVIFSEDLNHTASRAWSWSWSWSLLLLQTKLKSITTSNSSVIKVLILNMQW